MPPLAHGVDTFLLEIDGISAGSFVRCSGLGARTEVVEVAEGGRDEPHVLRGNTVFSNIRLERGVVRDHALFDWYLRGERRNGAIVLLSEGGQEVLRWTFTRGWPCRWEGPALDARKSEVALELLEIAHEGLRCIER
jgi:phage tail-like protein